MKATLLKDFGLVGLAALMLAAFFGLDRTAVGLEITFGGTWTSSSPGELYHWLGTTFLVLPAFLLIGEVVARRLDLVRFARPIVRRARTWWAIPATLVAGICFGAGHRIVRAGFPITDDQTGARFGGELLARGDITAPPPAYLDLMPNLYLYVRDGVMTSFDWPGAIAAWAIAEWTGLGEWFFGGLAGATFVAIVWFVGARLGRAWGGVAALLLATSPMFLSLSVTTHAHVASRFGIALSLALWWAGRQSERPEGRRSALLWAAAGAFAGVAWMTRPIETTALLAPLALFELSRAWRGEGSLRDVLAGFGPLLLAVALFVLHSYIVTDTLLPARLAGNNELIFPGAEHYVPPFAFFTDSDVFWNRLGANLGYNVMMLAIYAVGILGLPLAYLGIRDREDVALSLGIVAAFGVAMLHDDHGLHVVGPIHYSEVLVPFLYLVVSGLSRIHKAFASRPNLPDGATRLVPVLVIGMLGFGAIFSARHLAALQRESEVHREIYAVVDSDAHRDAIVLVSPYWEVWQALPRQTDSYVFDWRKEVAPDGAVIAMWRPRDRSSYADLIEAFPDRRILRVKVGGEPPQLQVRELDRERMLREAQRYRRR